MSVLPHIKFFNAVGSVQTKTNADMSRKHWLNYWHRGSHRCKRRVMHENDALPLKFNHTTVYANVVIACNGPKIRNCTNTEHTAMTNRSNGHIIL